MAPSANPFRLNVGFLINQFVGYSRDFVFDARHAHLAPDLDINDLSGVAKITRTAQGLLVQVQITATLESECVRCLKGMDLPVHPDFTELYAFSRNSITESNLLVPEDGQLNLVPVVREYVLLEIPIKPLCKPNCKGLCPVCGENLNEITCHHEDEEADPRLEILKSLLNKDKKA